MVSEDWIKEKKPTTTNQPKNPKHIEQQLQLLHYQRKVWKQHVKIKELKN